jgi:cytoskeleton protein RodZ
MSPAARTEPDTAGARLAGARERLGYSVDHVAEQLKLDPETIVALEQGDHRAIGATVFVRGFLRRYAALVGEAPTEIEALYARRPDAESRPDLSKTGMHRIESDAFRPRIGVLPALIAALALAIAGAAWWAMWSKPHPQPAPVATAVPSSVTVPATAPPAPAAEAAAPPSAEVKTFDPAARRRLQLSFSGECWAEVYDARGYRLFFGFGHAGTTQELNGIAPFRLVLGNGTAASLAMEGNPVSLPSGPEGKRLRIVLGGDGAATALP